MYHQVGNHGPTFRFLQALVTILFLSSLGTSVYRLHRRYTIRRLWWDDFAAFLVFLLNIVIYIQFWTVYYPNSHAEKVFNAWVAPLSFHCVVWLCRISISLTILRVLSAGVARNILVAMIVSFFLMWGVAMGGKIWQCGHDLKWVNSERVICPTFPQFGAIQVSLEIVSSVFLVAFPIYVLWGVDLNPSKRRLIHILFGLSAVFAFVAALHVIWFWVPDLNMQFISANIEAFVSTIVCNMLVVITRIYQLITLNTDSANSLGYTSEGTGESSGAHQPLSKPPPASFTQESTRNWMAEISSHSQSTGSTGLSSGIILTNPSDMMSGWTTSEYTNSQVLSSTKERESEYGKTDPTASKPGQEMWQLRTIAEPESIPLPPSVTATTTTNPEAV